MRRAYEIHPDRARWGRLGSIEATHSTKLPGVRCPICGAWAITGIIYPSVDTSALHGISLPRRPSPISVVEFDELAAAIQPIVGEMRPVRPGTDLGPLRGRAKGSIGDFAWVNPWTPLLRESVWISLKQAGIDLMGVRTELNYSLATHEPLIEIEALPGVTLIDQLVPEKCSICGHLPVKMPDNLIIAADSFDSSIPLQRIVELPTILVANELLAVFIRQNNLQDVLLTPIEVS